MGFFGRKRKKSGSIAKDRLALLLVADRVSCSAQTMQMLKNDMIKAAAKYVPRGFARRYRQLPAVSAHADSQHSPEDPDLRHSHMKITAVRSLTEKDTRCRQYA